MKKVPEDAHLICETGTPVRDAIKRIDASTPLLFQVVLDGDRRVVGTVTDGDIRRGFARGMQLDDMVETCMHVPPVVGRVGEEARNAEILHGRRFLPVCTQDGTYDHLLIEQVGPRRAERALIMAGGFGTRLGEKTKTTPKPLLPVAGKPLLEHILERLEGYGIRHVDISVHYLGEQIEKFVQDRDNDCEISIIFEDEPLGTAGCLSLIEHPVVEPILIMNADVLTDVDLNAMIEHHVRLDCDGTIAASRHEYTVPFGVLRFDDHDTLLGIDEKPTYYHMVSAGIYYMDPSIVRLVPKGVRMDMPELFEKAVENGLRLTVFPVHEYWSDVGRPDDLQNAHSFHMDRMNGK